MAGLEALSTLQFAAVILLAIPYPVRSVRVRPWRRGSNFDKKKLNPSPRSRTRLNQGP
jgi:hypothetical protein